MDVCIVKGKKKVRRGLDNVDLPTTTTVNKLLNRIPLGAPTSCHLLVTVIRRVLICPSMLIEPNLILLYPSPLSYSFTTMFPACKTYRFGELNEK